MSSVCTTSASGYGSSQPLGKRRLPATAPAVHRHDPRTTDEPPASAEKHRNHLRQRSNTPRASDRLVLGRRYRHGGSVMPIPRRLLWPGWRLPDGTPLRRVWICCACRAESQKAKLFDEQVAVPLGGRGEVEVERLSCRGDHVAVGQDHLPGEGPCGAGDHGDPVAASELDWVWVVVDVDVGEDAKHLLHHRGVRCPSVDRLCAPCDVRDHVVWVVVAMRAPFPGR